jgi:hypothetical protein
MPALSGLSKAWVEAEPARPDGWELLGVAKGPRELDLHIASAEWVAWRDRLASTPTIEPMRSCRAGVNQRNRP